MEKGAQRAVSKRHEGYGRVERGGAGDLIGAEGEGIISEIHHLSLHLIQYKFTIKSNWIWPVVKFSREIEISDDQYANEPWISLSL